MINDSVVQLIRDYLDHCAQSNGEATLVGMHWHVDGRHKTLPSAAEVNAAIASYPSLRAMSRNGSIVFGAAGDRQTVDDADMKVADAQYRKEFKVELKKLQNRS